MYMVVMLTCRLWYRAIGLPAVVFFFFPPNTCRSCLLSQSLSSEKNVSTSFLGVVILVVTILGAMLGEVDWDSHH